jgi:hypothetical protein
MSQDGSTLTFYIRFQDWATDDRSWNIHVVTPLKQGLQKL